MMVDVDVNTTTALIRAEYRLKTDEKTLWAFLESSYYKDGAFLPSEEAHEVLVDNFDKLFGLTVYAINPNNMKIKYCFIQDFIDGQAPYLYKHIFSQSELSELLPS